MSYMSHPPNDPQWDSVILFQQDMPFKHKKKFFALCSEKWWIQLLYVEIFYLDLVENDHSVLKGVERDNLKEVSSSIEMYNVSWELEHNVSYLCWLKKSSKNYFLKKIMNNAQDTLRKCEVCSWKLHKSVFCKFNNFHWKLKRCFIFICGLYSIGNNYWPFTLNISPDNISVK